MTYRLPCLCLMFLLLNLSGCQCSGDGVDSDTDSDSDSDSDTDSDSDSECEWPEQPECEDADIQPVDPACSDDGWCWVHPTPAGNPFRTLWDDGCTLYAGGAEGALAMVDLATGELVGFQNLYNDEYIYEITGFPDGRLVLYHGFSNDDGISIWDGEDLEELPMPEGDYDLELEDVEVDLNGDLYVTGKDYDEANDKLYAYFARWDGVIWERIPTDVEHGLHEMAVEPCGGMYILAGRANYLESYEGGCGVYYWNGQELIQEHWFASNSCGLFDIDVGQDGTVWAGGDGGYLLQRQADSTWQLVVPDVQIPLPSGVTNPWSFITIDSVAVKSKDAVVVSGNTYGSFGWNGKEWQFLWYDNDKIVYFNDVHSTDGHFWGSERYLYELIIEEASVVQKAGDGDVSISIKDVWISPTENVYLLGTNFHEDRPAIFTLSTSLEFEEMPLPQVETEYLRQIWGIDDENIWAVGPESTLLHYDGSTWEKQSLPIDLSLRDIWGSASDNVYFVADGSSTILHWNGTELETMETPINDLSSRRIWGSATDNIYIVTGGGGIIQYDGIEWSWVAPSPGPDAFIDVVGRGPNELYIAGVESVWRFDGTELTAENVGPYYYFNSIALHKTTGDIYVTSDDGLGAILRLSSGEWTEEDPGTFNPLSDIAFGDTVGFLAAGGLLSKQIE